MLQTGYIPTFNSCLPQTLEQTVWNINSAVYVCFCLHAKRQSEGTFGLEHKPPAAVHKYGQVWENSNSRLLRIIILICLQKKYVCKLVTEWVVGVFRKVWIFCRQRGEIEKGKGGGQARKEKTESHEKKTECRTCEFGWGGDRKDTARKEDIVENQLRRS